MTLYDFIIFIFSIIFFENPIHIFNKSLKIIKSFKINISFNLRTCRSCRLDSTIALNVLADAARMDREALNTLFAVARGETAKSKFRQSQQTLQASIRSACAAIIELNLFLFEFLYDLCAILHCESFKLRCFENLCQLNTLQFPSAILITHNCDFFYRKTVQ